MENNAFNVDLLKKRLAELEEEFIRDSFSVKILRWTIVCGLNAKDIGWVRFFWSGGPGFNWKYQTRKNLLFSDRYNLGLFVDIGKWRFRFLKPF